MTRQKSLRQARRTYQGTIEEVFSHRNEIPEGTPVELRVFDAPPVAPSDTPTMTLLRSWLEEDATDDPEEIRAAEEELRQFKRNMNRPRQEAGARLLYPEAE
jgi:hypothetical protein